MAHADDKTHVTLLQSNQSKKMEFISPSASSARDLGTRLHGAVSICKIHTPSGSNSTGLIKAVMLLAMKTRNVIGAFRSVFCHSSTAVYCWSYCWLSFHDTTDFDSEDDYRTGCRDVIISWFSYNHVPVNSFERGVDHLRDHQDHALIFFRYTWLDTYIGICYLSGQEAFFVESLTRVPSLILNTAGVAIRYFSFLGLIWD